MFKIFFQGVPGDKGVVGVPGEPGKRGLDGKLGAKGEVSWKIFGYYY